ncbi:MAG TPA: ABC transporter ATP-binding protein [Acetobacteraceae bacterium]|nr:ABC transporter ATP-binding protein [Acetobacteraceae bacterium]
MSLRERVRLPRLRPRTPDAEPDRAIVATNLIKDVHTEHGPRRVLDGISFRVGQGERLAVLGRNGAGKSTLIQLLSGLQRPTGGHIHRGLSMSWPLGLSGGFVGEMTGYDNVRFIAAIYNAPWREVLDYVADFTELGESLYEPVRIYSNGMHARLSLALSLAINFECLLIDEVIVVGDQRFQRKCFREIFEKRRHHSMILAVHATDVVEQFCTQALVLKDGRGRIFTDLKAATRIYATL